MDDLRSGVTAAQPNRPHRGLLVGAMVVAVVVLGRLGAVDAPPGPPLEQASEPSPEPTAQVVGARLEDWVVPEVRVELTGRHAAAVELAIQPLADGAAPFRVGDSFELMTRMVMTNISNRLITLDEPPQRRASFSGERSEIRVPEGTDAVRVGPGPSRADTSTLLVEGLTLPPGVPRIVELEVGGRARREGGGRITDRVTIGDTLATLTVTFTTHSLPGSLVAESHSLRGMPLPEPDREGSAVPVVGSNGDPLWVIRVDGAVTVVDARAPDTERGIRQLVGWCPTQPLFVQAGWRTTFATDGRDVSGEPGLGLRTYMTEGDQAGARLSRAAPIDSRPVARDGVLRCDGFVPLITFPTNLYPAATPDTLPVNGRVFLPSARIQIDGLGRGRLCPASNDGARCLGGSPVDLPAGGDGSVSGPAFAAFELPLIVTVQQGVITDAWATSVDPAAEPLDVRGLPDPTYRVMQFIRPGSERYEQLLPPVQHRTDCQPLLSEDVQLLHPAGVWDSGEAPDIRLALADGRLPEGAVVMQTGVTDVRTDAIEIGCISERLGDGSDAGLVPYDTLVVVEFREGEVWSVAPLEVAD